jgi:hypothetical protein
LRAANDRRDPAKPVIRRTYTMSSASNPSYYPELQGILISHG